MGIFHDDSSSLHQPIPRSILIAIGSVALVLATYGWKSIAETREKNRITQALKEGWLTISQLQFYIEENNGQWPKKWSDLRNDRSEKVDIDFSLTVNELVENPTRIYSAIRLKQHPELQARLKQDLDEFRKWLKEKRAQWVK